MSEASEAPGMMLQSMRDFDLVPMMFVLAKKSIHRYHWQNLKKLSSSGFTERNPQSFIPGSVLKTPL